MSVDVTYGNFSFLSNSLLIPYVSRQQNVIYYGKKHGQVTEITLDGSVIGTFAEINSARNLILAQFSTDFLSFKIIEDQVVIVEFQKCTVKNVDFTAGNFGKIAYSITLECHEEDLFFSQAFGVLDPKNSFSFSEEENGIIKITHSVSARGLATSAQLPINNAKNFVESISGWYPDKNIYPNFINGIVDSNVILTSVNKKIDTASSTYSQDESYSVQIAGIGVAPLIAGVVSEISSSVTQGVREDFSKIEITYSVMGGRHTTVDNLRASTPTTATLFNLATEAYGSLSVNPSPTSYNIEDEAETSKKITIKVSYDTNLLFGQNLTYFDYSVDFSTDHVTDITSVTINGEIKARDSVNRFVDVSNFYSAIQSSNQKLSGYLYERASAMYSDVLNLSWPLKPNFESMSVDQDPLRGTISFSATFTNEDFLNGCSKAEYSLDIDPQLKRFSSQAGCNFVGLHGIFDLRTYPLENVSIKGSLEGSEVYKNSSNLFFAKYSNLTDSLISAFVYSDLSPGKLPLLTKESATTGTYPNINVGFNLDFKVDKFTTFS